MPRLTIAIICFERTDLLEETLVSVLQHRPVESEVLVIHDGRYTDPYQLGDEVQFVVSEESHSWVSAANTAIRAARAPVVNLLAAGLEVTGGWYSSALSFFDDHRVASVSPVLLDAGDPSRLSCAGVQLGWLGERCVTGRGRKADRRSISRLKSLGPNMIGAFYRRADVLSLDGFRDVYGDELGDLDLALRLREVQVETVIDPDSQVLVDEIDRPRRQSAVQRGRGHQRFLREHLGSERRLGYWLATVGNGLLEVLTVPRSPRNLAILWGRLSELRSGAEASEVREESELHDDDSRVTVLSLHAERKDEEGAYVPDRRAA